MTFAIDVSKTAFPAAAEWKGGEPRPDGATRRRRQDKTAEVGADNDALIKFDRVNSFHGQYTIVPTNEAADYAD
ncbi:MAG: hypothetical protein NTV79_03275 [Candidatus Aureabacteria bacterium]|nr:hypothetical protein [Candidatus Auribacterota bacterium]